MEFLRNYAGALGEVENVTDYLKRAREFAAKAEALSSDEKTEMLVIAAQDG